MANPPSNQCALRRLARARCPRPKGPSPARSRSQSRFLPRSPVGVLRNRRVVVLAGPAANRLVLIDTDGNFSNRLGWEVALDFFSGFVLLRDFEDHALHRNLLRPFFKPDALRRDLACMHRVIRNETASLGGSADACRLPKRIALDIDLAVFGGFASAQGDEIYATTKTAHPPQRHHRGTVPFFVGTNLQCGCHLPPLPTKDSRNPRRLVPCASGTGAGCQPTGRLRHGRASEGRHSAFPAPTGALLHVRKLSALTRAREGRMPSLRRPVLSGS